ncbi:unnamed protein product [Didymodactylos carnosus]|uniref:Uncharacterized protein n=1 Tax=Didymodactylos carnosus TaxID=1234261 RepID=A0A815G584_9BILA|nr:unnamed protein product [Didymodactylos carnosus]CAF4191009.1 unnamed protein product [Didymodactylos carnosus]
MRNIRQTFVISYDQLSSHSNFLKFASGLFDIADESGTPRTNDKELLSRAFLEFGNELNEQRDPPFSISVVPCLSEANGTEPYREPQQASD